MFPPAAVAVATAARAERNPLLTNGARTGGATTMSTTSAVCIGALLVTAGIAAVGASVLAAGGSGGGGGGGDDALASRAQLVVFRTVVEGDADTYDTAPYRAGVAAVAEDAPSS